MHIDGGERWSARQKRSRTQGHCRPKSWLRHEAVEWPKSYNSDREYRQVVPVIYRCIINHSEVNGVKQQLFIILMNSVCQKLGGGLCLVCIVWGLSWEDLKAGDGFTAEAGMI